MTYLLASPPSGEGLRWVIDGVSIMEGVGSTREEVLECQSPIAPNSKSCCR